MSTRRSNSSGDPSGIPFGGAIPEGSPFDPALRPALASPFANDLHAVSTGGLMSLGAQQQYALLYGTQQQQQQQRAGEPRRSDNASQPGSGERGSMHSVVSEGLASQQASMAGIMLEGLEEWEIQPDEIVLGPRIGIGRCGAAQPGPRPGRRRRAPPASRVRAARTARAARHLAAARRAAPALRPALPCLAHPCTAALARCTAASGDRQTWQ